ncbi:MAG TPA: hypothetical protein VGE25_11695 [Sediminibacterium sp.]
MSDSLLRVYQERADQYRTEKKSLTKQLSLNSLLRLVFFLLFAWFVYTAFRQRFEGFALGYALLCIAVFLFWVSRAAVLKQRIAFQQQLILINENEIGIANGKSSCFEDGAEVLRSQGFANDLTIFGKNSLYHVLNRTGSKPGKQKLATALLVPSLNKQQIEEQQACVQELSDKIHFRQTLLAHTLLLKEEEALPQMMAGLPEKAGNTLQQSPWKQLAWIWPIAGVLLISYSIWVDQYTLLLLFTVLGLLVLSLVFGKISQLYNHISKKSYLFTQYATCFDWICSARLEHPGLQQKQQRLAEAAGAFRKLARITGVFDLRLSLFSFFVNGLFLSDLICALAYLQWNKRYQSAFKDWFDAMGEIEMLNSVANFQYNHPSFVFPEIVTDQLMITAAGLGHPLMKTDTAVCNDFSIGDPARLHLITGSNMSGKSTFLRAIGLNMVLAQLGAPVFAQSFSCRPVRILTSFHHIDSLEESTSYFYAELKCLQTIIQSLAAPEPALVLLDEVMRGTNSTDKHDGTALLIRKIVQQNCLTLIATHDIELGILATEYPGMVENFCFESEVTETGLHFDFRKRNGIAQSKNATYLMKQMGIV